MQRLYPEITVELEERSDKERCLIIRADAGQLRGADISHGSHVRYN